VRVYYESMATTAAQFDPSGDMAVAPHPPNLAYEWTEAQALAEAGHIVELANHFGPVATPQVVVASTELAAPRAAQAAKIYGVPWVCRFMAQVDPDAPAFGVYDQCVAAASKATRLYAASPLVADQVSARFSRPVAVIPHPVRVPKEEDVVAARRDLDVLFVGWLSETKRVDMLIRACHTLRLSLGIVGSGPDAGPLMALAEALGARVDFFGPLFGEALWATYLRAKRYASASITDSWAIPIGEALAHGCDVVHFKSWPIREIWGDRVAWWETEQELVRALERPPATSRLIGRNYVLAQGYDAPYVGRSLAQLLRETTRTS